MTFTSDVPQMRIRDLVPRLLLAISFAVGLWYGLRSVYAAVQFVPYAGVGIFLVLRRPRNVIGWTLLGLSWCFLMVETPNDLDLAALQSKSAGPLLQSMAWMGAWAGSAAFALFFLLAVVFPSGRIPRGGWGRLVRMALVADGVLIVLASFQPMLGGSPTAGEEPIGIPNPLALFPEASFWEISRGGQLIFPVLGLMLAGAVSIVIRYRRAQGLERQQFRWLVSSFAFVAVAVPIGLATIALVGPGAETLGWIPAQIAFLMVPISIGIAVMRYRLYEIDRIISRTLAYALLTAVLAGVYLAGFLGLQAILAPLIANGGSIAVAASTLTVFALFQPIRRRIQGVVDRRFNRGRYDASREIDGFAARVRDEVEVDRLTVALATTLERTMQPASASIWLRGR